MRAVVRLVQSKSLGLLTWIVTGAERGGPMNTLTVTLDPISTTNELSVHMMVGVIGGGGGTLFEAPLVAGCSFQSSIESVSIPLGTLAHAVLSLTGLVSRGVLSICNPLLSSRKRDSPLGSMAGNGRSMTKYLFPAIELPPGIVKVIPVDRVTIFQSEMLNSESVGLNNSIHWGPTGGLGSNSFITMSIPKIAWDGIVL